MLKPLFDHTPKTVRDKLYEVELLLRDAKKSYCCGDLENGELLLQHVKFELSVAIIMSRSERIKK